MKDINIGASPLTGTIFAGKLNKAGNMWLNGKVDVTGQAVSAVASNLLHTQENFYFTSRDKNYVLLVMEIFEDQNEKL